MYTDAWKETFERAELHGKPVLFTPNRVLPETVPEPVEPELPEELLPEPDDEYRRTLEPVSFAIVRTPTEPSLARPLALWKFLTAFSVTSPKYPVTFAEDR